ncbi:MAG: hypothetical protein OEZ36_00055 [Spirochaetota bacterium]|nr:hypothetical protein [Spirochaetota bacterium]
MKHSIILIIGVLILYTCGYQPGQRAEKPGQSDESKSKKSKRTHGKQYGHGRGGYIGSYDQSEEEIKKEEEKWKKLRKKYLKSLPVLKPNYHIKSAYIGTYIYKDISITSGSSMVIKSHRDREIYIEKKTANGYKVYKGRKLKKGKKVKISLKYAISPAKGQPFFREAKNFTYFRLRKSLISLNDCEGKLSQGIKCVVYIKYSTLYPEYMLHKELLKAGLAENTKYSLISKPSPTFVLPNNTEEWKRFEKKVIYRNQVEYPEIEPKDDSENIEDEE